MRPPALSSPVLRRLLVGAASLAFAFNVLAFRHAWSFTHPGPSDTPRINPRHLSTADGIRLPSPVSMAKPRDQVSTSAKLRRLSVPAEGSAACWSLVHPGRTATSSSSSTARRASPNCSHARRLHGMGPSVLMVDFAGSGGSGDAPFTIGVRESEDVTAATAYARALTGARRVYLYGLSMGAVAILKSAAEGTSVDGIILECPFDSLLTTVRHRSRRWGCRLSGRPRAALLGRSTTGILPPRRARLRAPSCTSGPLDGGRPRSMGHAGRDAAHLRCAGWTQEPLSVSRSRPRLMPVHGLGPLDGGGQRVRGAPSCRRRVVNASVS